MHVCVIEVDMVACSEYTISRDGVVKVEEAKVL
jgi:hypothetical protein